MSHDVEDIRCETMWKLTEDKKYDEIVDHVLGGCMNCITNPKKLTNGREMLFPDGLPPWIKVPEAEKQNPVAWKKYEKKKVNVQMTPEEFEQFLVDSDLGDEAMIFEIVKFMRIERLAAWPKLREIRKKQREIRAQKEKEKKLKEKKEQEAKRDAEKLKKSDEKRKSMEAKKLKEDEQKEYLEKMNEEEKLLEEVLGGGEAKDPENEEDGAPKHKKEFNLKNQMPWLPSTFDILCLEKRSVVGQDQQKRMIAMCQNFMSHGAYQHQANRRELKDIRVAAAGEYEALVEAALDHANKETCHPIDFVSDQIIKQSLFALHRKSPKTSSFLFKKPLIQIENRSFEGMEGVRSEQQAQIPKLERILKKPNGIDVLTVPDITKKCAMSKNRNIGKMKVSLQEDETARKILESTVSVSVAMDATTACHLLSPNWESREYEFGIHIEVKEVISHGLTRKLVVLNKPYPYVTVTKSSLQRKMMKRILKNQFVECHKYQKHQKIKTVKNENPGPSSEAPESSETPESQESQEKIEKTDQTEKAPEAGFLDNLFAEMEKKKVENQEENQEPSIETGYQYSIFQCGQQKMLIRSHPPYQVLEPSDKKRKVLENKTVSFEPRIEYLPNGGAMDLSPAEWVWNYTKKLMKQSDAHILYRASYKLDNVLQIDAVTMKTDVCEPPPSALAILSTRTMMLEELLARLEHLEPGSYLAYQETNKPLVVLSQSEDAIHGVSTEAMKIKEDDVKTLSETLGDNFFHGFSPEVALQWQVVQGRAPRLLMAKDSPMNELVPSRNSVDKIKRRKSSYKRKFDRIAGEKSQEKRFKSIDLDDPNLDVDFSNPSVLNAMSKGSERGRGKWQRGGNNRGRGERGGNRGKRGGNWRGRGNSGFSGVAGPSGSSEPSGSGPSTSTA